MPKLFELEPVFVDTVPHPLELGKLYVSKKYETVLHLCACGECNQETVTPIRDPQTGWQYTEVDGLVTLHPSIGNFQMPCRSHYWIQENKVVWC